MKISSREEMEEAFSMGEANCFLSGQDVLMSPLYVTLKAKVLSGEMNASEIGDAIIDYAIREQAKRSRA